MGLLGQMELALANLTGQTLLSLMGLFGKIELLLASLKEKLTNKFHKRFIRITDKIRWRHITR